jgi:Flp pilus assembly pilin Flp
MSKPHQDSKAAAPGFLRDESGQTTVEWGLILVLLIIPVIFVFDEVIDGFVSYYSYIVAMICLPVP